MDKFIERAEIRQGPKARIYLPTLLNWVQFNQAKELKARDAKLWRIIYQSTPFGDGALKQAIEPTFNQPPLYRHYFVTFAGQVDVLRTMSQIDRYRTLRTWIKEAIALNAAIEDDAIDLERHGSGEHLQPWLNVINRYYAGHLKG